jgi:hypothetical protein
MPLDMSVKEILPDERLAAAIRLTTVDPLWFMVQRMPLQMLSPRVLFVATWELTCEAFWKASPA